MFKPFRFWCQKVLPLVYDDSLSYYELLNKVVDYLNHIGEHMNVTDEQIGEIEQILGDVDNLQQYVNEWLDEHPEATTTVEDGAITEAKIQSDFLSEIKNPFVTPQMFGAEAYTVGEVEPTDARSAFEQAIVYCRDNHCDLMLISDYYINAYKNGALANILVESGVRIFGNSANERYPTIYLDRSNNDGTNFSFLVLNSAVTLTNFSISSYSGYLPNTRAVKCQGVSLDCDNELNNIIVNNFEIGCLVLGRNVKVNGCSFSYCNYGVIFQPEEPVSANYGQFRGWIVNNTRFHGIGNHSTWNWFANSSCIYVDEKNYSNVQITDCHADLCGTFYKGYGTNVLISGCFMDNYSGIQIDIGDANDTPYAPGQYGLIAILNNFISGKTGQVQLSPAVYADYPEHIIAINNCYRVSITGNIIKLSGKELVKVNGCTWVHINSNSTMLGGQTDGEINGFVRANDNDALFVKNNSSLANSTFLLTGGNNQHSYVENNTNYLVSNLSTTNFIPANKTFVTLKTVTSNNSATGMDYRNIPNHFFVQANDNLSLFECTHNGKVFSSTIVQYADGSGFSTLRWLFNTDNTNLVVPVFTDYSYSDLSTHTARAYTLSILAEI